MRSGRSDPEEASSLPFEGFGRGARPFGPTRSRRSAAPFWTMLSSLPDLVAKVQKTPERFVLVRLNQTIGQLECADGARKVIVPLRVESLNQSNHSKISCSTLPWDLHSPCKYRSAFLIAGHQNRFNASTI